MKNKFLGFSLLSALLLAGCTPATEALPSDKTIIRIYGYAGGYGEQWMRNLCERFAEQEKETSFEEGKVGVYFVYTFDKKSPSMSNEIKPTDYDIMFTEDARPYEWYLDDCFEEITDVVTGTNKYEPGKTIESKMSTIQQETYKFNGKYYGMPTYSGFYGISYNKDLFDESNLYFSGVNEGEFISSELEPKSAGPDGVVGTYDDGLPVTSDDFIALCNEADNANADPILFSGEYRKQYGVNWMFNMAATIDGLDVTRERFDFKGVNNVPVVKIENGKANGNFENVNITKENGYELYRTKGFYEAAKLLSDVMCNGQGKFLDKTSCLGETVTQTDAQTYFLKPVNRTNKKAMLFEGNWWRNEVKSNMKKIPGTESINFGWMPVPRLAGQTESYYLDALGTYAFIRKDSSGKRSSEKLNCLKDLIRFAYTDESLVDFSVETDTFFNLNYDMGERADELSSYGKSVLDFMKSSHTHILPGFGVCEDSRKHQSSILPHHRNLEFANSNSVTTNFVDYYANKQGDQYKFNQKYDEAFPLFYNSHRDSWWGNNN